MTLNKATGSAFVDSKNNSLPTLTVEKVLHPSLRNMTNNEGTNFVAKNLPGALSVIAIAEKGNLFNMFG